MSDEIKTRRLIVTLPDVSGEESDIVAEDLEGNILANLNMIGYQDTWERDALQDARDTLGKIGNVTHALGETVPPFFFFGEPDAGRVYFLAEDPADGATSTHYLSPLEARQLAGVLLAQAEEIEAAE